MIVPATSDHSTMSEQRRRRHGNVAEHASPTTGDEHLRRNGRTTRYEVSVTDLWAAVPSPDTMAPEDCEACEAAVSAVEDALLTSDAETRSPTHTVFQAGHDDEPVEPLRAYLHRIRQIPLLRPEDVVDLAKRIEHGDLGARDRLVESNLRLVVKVAFTYARRSGMEIDDMIQEGNKGLIHGVEKFDWRRGVRFSTYTIYWIRQAIMEALARHRRTIRVTLHGDEQIKRIRAAQERLTQALGRRATAQDIARERITERLARTNGDAPTEAQVAELVWKMERKIGDLFRADLDPLSLSAPVGSTGDGDDDWTVADTCGDRDGPSPEQAVVDPRARRSLQKRVCQAVSVLPVKYRVVIAYRFGLGQSPYFARLHVGRRRDFMAVHTHEQTASRLCLSVEQVRRREVAALAHLKSCGGWGLRFR